MNATTTEVREAAAPSLGDTLRTILKPIASLQLTVALFAMSLVLVFFGTLAQKNAGIWVIVDQYFWSLYVLIDTQLFVQFSQIFFGLSPEAVFSYKIPFPGGKLIGFAMFANLLAAHTVRFKLSWRRAGIFILHGGILLMFVGEFITRTYTIEQQMVIPEGGSTNYTIDTRNYELAIIDDSAKDTERVVSVPGQKLHRNVGEHIVLPEAEVPVDLKVLAYYRNAEIYSKGSPEAAKAKGPEATAGTGKDFVALEVDTVSGVESEKKSDNPTAIIEVLRKGSGESLGTYLFALDKPQRVEIGNKDYEFWLRNTHYYKPYALYLNKFRFDRYLGTDKPKNYSSDVRLTDPERGVDSTVKIAMNEPMRYRGETFYQSSFTPDETTTILSVVENPGWIIPYVSCGVVVFGMVLHFGMHLFGYLRRLLFGKVSAGEKKQLPIILMLAIIGLLALVLTILLGVFLLVVPLGACALIVILLNRSRTIAMPVQTLFERRLPWGVLAATALVTILAAMPHGKPGKGGLDLERVARIPVVEGGRVKPLDTVARVDLRQINHKETYYSPADRDTRHAIDWWLDTASIRGKELAGSSSAKAEVFRIESDQVLNLLGLPRREGLRYSISEIAHKYPEIQKAAAAAKMRPDKQRDIFDAHVLELWTKLGTHNAILSGEGTLVIPPGENGEWRTLASAREAAGERALESISKASGVPIQSGEQIAAIMKNLPDNQKEKFQEIISEAMYEETLADPGYNAWENLFAAYRHGDAEKFDKAVEELNKLAAAGVSSGDLARVNFEAFLNDTAFYFWCIGLYVLAFLLTAGSWVCFSFNPGLGEAWRKSAFLVLLFTFALHTFTLISRMYLMDRPLVFVTNLYSTAVFIGWAAVGLSLIVEKLIPITLGCIVASILGFLTSLLAHNLAASGDTLEMMQAVLDTNFWLATHVTTINLGYATTYMAGLIGILYLVMGIFTPYLKTPIDLNGKKQELGRIVGQILYGAIAGATVLSFTGTVLGGIWGDQSWGRFWGWDPKENGALMIVIWNAMILHARWAGLVKDRGIAVLALGGNMITTWSYFGTNQLGVGLHAYGFSNTLAMVCVVMWLVNLALVGMGLLPKKYWRSYQAN